MNFDTIAALSTARGKGGVAMIRISGEDALSVCSAVFKPLFKDKFENPEPRKCYYGNIIRDSIPIDDVTVTYFKGPKSYTGEDVCEICCHGGVYVTQAVLETVLSNGARLAFAGEFTKRAYMNGKLSLSRAEAVGQIIDASNDAQLRLSSNASSCVLSQKLDEIKAVMLDLIARSYVVVDYPDEDLPSVEREFIATSLEKIEKELEKLKMSYRATKAITQGVKTAIVGRPNAGKSSLYNLLSGEELAIVTDIAGTTRDVIENTVSVGDVTLRLADTAGIRDTDDTVEKIGVERAKEKMDTSELVFCVFDASEKENDEDIFIAENATQKSAIAIINKSDKSKKMSDLFENKIKDKFKNIVYLSAKTGEGVDEIVKIVERMYSLDEINITSDAMVMNARQLSSVASALEKTREAIYALNIGETPDIVCYSLEVALSELEMIDAKAVSEEIVDSIFSRFCVGK